LLEQFGIPAQGAPPGTPILHQLAFYIGRIATFHMDAFSFNLCD
jgi:hypothetical protein